MVLIEPDIFPDDRGYFFESFQKVKLRELGIDTEFVQDNESMSTKNVLRGLHFQHPPYSQGKLARVVKGAAQDVAVDLRLGSPTYGKWFSTVLNSSTKTMMWIPAGFAHGFLTLEDDTIFQYKCSNYYHRESEYTFIWNDPDLGVKWMSDQPIVSIKDLRGKPFREFTSPFHYNIK